MRCVTTDNIMMVEVLLRSVLFAAGTAVHSKRFQPMRDDSQWWNRHDALVRCTAAFLFSATLTTMPETTSNANHRSRRELVILFDDDWSRIHMTYSPPLVNDIRSTSTFLIPTEQTIISIWKQASLQPNRSIVVNGLFCQMIPYPKNNTDDELIQIADDDSNDAPTSTINKRSVLTKLQNSCSIDFLRQHKLNSSMEVLLRKTKKETLVQVWNLWCHQNNQPITNRKMLMINDDDPKQKQLQRQKARNETSNSYRIKNNNSNDSLEFVLQELLRSPPPMNDYEPGVVAEQIVAVTLHESSRNELPCWWCDHQTSNSQALTGRKHEDGQGSSNSSIMVVLFLGAVRDMSPEEIQCLERVCCRRTPIPIIPVRIGPIAEFTSKILSVVSFHENCNRLIPALLKLVAIQQETPRQQNENKNSRKWKDKMLMATKKRQKIDQEHSRQQHHQEDEQQKQQQKLRESKLREEIQNNLPTNPLSLNSSTSVHFVCLVHVSSKRVVTDLKDRSYTLWCMVRVIVTSLWRSKFASSHYSNNILKKFNPSSTETISLHDNNNNNNNNYKITTNNPMVNILTLIFDDGIALTLHQDEIVTNMANQHQAAPTEYQILETIREKIIQQQKHSSPVVHDDYKEKRSKMKHVVHHLFSSSILTESTTRKGNRSVSDPAPIPTCIWNVHDSSSISRNKGSSHGTDPSDKNSLWDEISFDDFFYNNELMRQGCNTTFDGVGVPQIAPSNPEVQSCQDKIRHARSQKNALILFSISSECIFRQSSIVLVSHGTTKLKKRQDKFIKSTLKQFQGHHRIPVVQTSIPQKKFGIDCHAVIVTILQHCCYQNPDFLFQPFQQQWHINHSKRQGAKERKNKNRA